MKIELAHHKAQHIDRKCVVVTALYNQPEAFVSDFGDDQSRYLLREGLKAVFSVLQLNTLVSCEILPSSSTGQLTSNRFKFITDCCCLIKWLDPLNLLIWEWNIKQASHGLWGSVGLKMHIHAHFFLRTILTREVGQIDLVLVWYQGSLVGLCVQDYKSLCAAVTICSIQTYT